MLATSSPATAMRYRDVAAAVDWLCKAFGFEKQTVVSSDDGAIEYAQLTCGRVMLMLAPVRDTPLDKLMKQPDEVGGGATQSCYIVVDDADAHYATAKDAGAEVVLDLQDDDFGGRGYTCRDPEGHLWMFGTYDPWQGEFPEPASAPAAAAPERLEAAAPEAAPERGRGGRPVMLAGLAMTVIGVLAVVAWVGLKQPSAVSSAAVVQQPAVAPNAATEAQERAAEAAEQAREARTQLERERAARASADKAGADAQKRIAEEQRAREAAERGLREARAELERERVAKAAVELAKSTVEKTNTGALERAAADQRAREAAEKAAKEAREQLERERTAITAAEMAKEFALGRADEERLAREAAERAVEEMRNELDRARGGKAPSAPPTPMPTDTDASKRLAKVQQAFESAQKQVAEAQRAREAAEKAAKETREQLEREQAAKAAAWKVVGQLTRQLRQAQGGSPSGEAADGGDDGSKKPRPPKKKK